MSEDHVLSAAEDEFADSADPRDDETWAVDFSALWSPAVWWSIAGIALGIAVLVWPERTDQILTRLTGFGLAVGGASAVWTSLVDRDGARSGVRARAVGVAGGLVIFGLGAFLAIDPKQSEQLVGRIVAVGIGLVAIRSAVQRWDGPRSRPGTGGPARLVHEVEISDRESRGWLIVRTVALLAIAILIFVFPSQLLVFAVTVAALLWILVSAVAVGAAFDARYDGVATPLDGADLAVRWLVDRHKSSDSRSEIYDKIFYEGPTTKQRVVRFFALMGFASVIASMGVVTDSTAVVIGAMLIAPLLTPLMGMAMSLVMGWPRRLATSAMVAIGGIVFSISIGFVIGLVVPTVIDTATNSQIVSRSSPTVLDLIIAVAAGAAGAYGLSRADVSDSLPGVAIAIALVPPLGVVGISFSQGDWDSGTGAFLLFLTNMVAILVMGGITFIITGVTPVQRVAANQHRVRTAVATVGLMLAIVIGGLFLNGSQITRALFETGLIEQSVADWLEPADEFDLVSIDDQSSTVVVVVVGPPRGMPDPQTLADDLAETLDRDVDVDVRHVIQERISVQGEAG